MTDAQSHKPWQQLDDEPIEWFARFQVYLDLGPFRSLTAAYRIWTHSNGKPSKTASDRAQQFNWDQRALAYDQDQREGEAARAAAARQRRLDHFDRIINIISNVIDKAELENLSKEEARALLPTLRPIYARLLEQERLELPTLPEPDKHPTDNWPKLFEQANKLLETHPPIEENDDDPR